MPNARPNSFGNSAQVPHLDCFGKSDALLLIGLKVRPTQKGHRATGQVEYGNAGSTKNSLRTRVVNRPEGRWIGPGWTWTVRLAGEIATPRLALPLKSFLVR